MVRILVSPALPSERTIALGLMMGRCADEERWLRITDVLEAAEAGEIRLDGLLLARVEGDPLGATLSVAQPDEMAFAWPPGVSVPDEWVDAIAASLGDAHSTDASPVSWEKRRETAEKVVARELLRAQAEWLDRSPARYAQLLLEPGSDADLELLREFQFERLATLELRQGQITDRLPPARLGFPGTIHPYDELNDPERFAGVIERSYIDSHDCPAFTGRRNGLEALHSHAVAAHDDTRYWWLFEDQDGDAGVMLMAIHAADRAGEVLYVGVAPECRGRGLGEAMLQHAIQAAREAGADRICLCVDAENHYARAVYDRLGIVTRGVRTVYLRWSCPPSA